jgi:glycosyltransferase involved in cell wall biosynthesis
MKIALVHDWMNQIGGAEDVLETMVGLYPQAPIFTSLYAPNKMPAHWRHWDIRTGFIDRLPFSHRKQQLYFPLYPFVFEKFDLRHFDVVLTNKSGFSHGVITGPDTVHICYCLTPTRYIWRYHQYVEQENIGRMTQRMLWPFLTFLRQWDRLAADRVDHFIAISQEVRRRIAKVYRRDSVIIYPPVDTSRFAPVPASGGGGLLPLRWPIGAVPAAGSVDPGVQSAGLAAAHRRQRSRPRAAGGDGRTERASSWGTCRTRRCPALVARARAFVFPGEEDFGIAPVQAMAAGRPVIAYAGGGSLDTIKHEETGFLFSDQSVEGIIAAVEAFDAEKTDVEFVRAHALQFDTAVFRQKISAFINQKRAESDSRP